jgi:hypothetical protein
MIGTTIVQGNKLVIPKGANPSLQAHFDIGMLTF